MSSPAAALPIEPVGVEYQRIVKQFGATRALDDFTLAIEPGELIALLGPSGCGKTTALRMLAGFDTPDSGQILVGGNDVSRVPVNKRGMGMVFQSYSLFPTMTATDNVAFGQRLRKVPAGQRRARARELLDLVGLDAHVDKFPHQLSGGQQQRVALARALAVQPQVLLLDEPLSALDAKVRAQLRDEIRRIQTELGVTTVFVTHDQEEALSMADRVGVMRAGRLEGCAAPSELYARPPSAFVAEFVGTMNRLEGDVRTDRVVVHDQPLAIDGEVPANGTRVRALIRPEGVLVAPVRPEARGNAHVVHRMFFGAMTRLRLTMDDGTEVIADISTHHAGGLSDGQPCVVTFLDRPVLVQPV